MVNHDKIRKDVSTSYARAVKAGSGCCGGGTVAQGALAKLADYTREELDSLPPEAVVSSFGCGNPLAFSEVKEGDVVLDLGSGAGIDLLLAAKKVGPTGRVIGVDMTDEMIDHARQSIAAAGLNNVEVRKGIIEELPVEDVSVDWVISNCVINLSPEKHKVFAEIARVLKPGGQMRVSDVVVQDLPDWARQDEYLYSNCVAGAISEEDYMQGLRDAGLHDVEIRDRIIYDASQLKGLVSCDPILEEAGSTEAGAEPAGSTRTLASSGCCGTTPADGDRFARIAEELTGKVWSASFAATK